MIIRDNQIVRDNNDNKSSKLQGRHVKTSQLAAIKIMNINEVCYYSSFFIIIFSSLKSISTKNITIIVQIFFFSLFWTERDFFKNFFHFFRMKRKKLKWKLIC